MWYCNWEKILFYTNNVAFILLDYILKSDRIRLRWKKFLRKIFDLKKIISSQLLLFVKLKSATIASCIFADYTIVYSFFENVKEVG